MLYEETAPVEFRRRYSIHDQCSRLNPTCSSWMVQYVIAGRSRQLHNSRASTALHCTALCARYGQLTGHSPVETDHAPLDSAGCMLTAGVRRSRVADVSSAALAEGRRLSLSLSLCMLTVLRLVIAFTVVPILFK